MNTDILLKPKFVKLKCFLTSRNKLVIIRLPFPRDILTIGVLEIKQHKIKIEK